MRQQNNAHIKIFYFDDFQNVNFLLPHFGTTITKSFNLYTTITNIVFKTVPICLFSDSFGGYFAHTKEILY